MSTIIATSPTTTPSIATASDRHATSSSNGSASASPQPAAIQNNAAFPTAPIQTAPQVPTPSGTRANGRGLQWDVPSNDADPGALRELIQHRLSQANTAPVSAPPSSQAVLSKWLKQALKEKYGQDIDPDHTYLATLNYDKNGSSGSALVPGNVERKVSLTQAFQQSAQGNAQGNTQGPTYEGVYRESQPQRYDAGTQLPIRPEDLRTLMQKNDPNAIVRSQLNAFWKQNEASYPDNLRGSLLKSALQDIPVTASKQTKPGDLRPEDLGVVAGMVDANSASHVETNRLMIDGHIATDVLVGQDTKSGRTVLYMPGDKTPLHGFDSKQELDAWLAADIKDPARRQALASHFPERDRQDDTSASPTRSGVDSVLSGVAAYPKPYAPPGGDQQAQSWDPSKYFSLITGGDDPINMAYLSTRERSYNDADTLVTPNDKATQSAGSASTGSIVVNGDSADVQTALNFLKGDTEMATIISDLEKSGQKLTISYVNNGRNSYNKMSNKIEWDPHTAFLTKNGGKVSPSLALGHELAHAQGRLKGTTAEPERVPDYGSAEERRVITGPERHAALTFHQGVRNEHDAAPYKVDGPLSV
jgi:hypothetical protein